MRSKYKNSQLIITLIVSFGCLSGAMSLLLKNQYTDKAGFLFLFLLIVFAYSLIGFFYAAPVIFIDEKFLSFKRLFQKRIYAWDQVSNVILTKQEIFSPSLLFGRNEGMKLYFNDGRSLIIWSDAYSNMGEIRKFITHKVNNNIQVLNKRRQTDSNNMFIEKKYAGNPFIHYHTLMLAGIGIIFCFTIKVRNGNEVLLFLPFGMILIMFIGLGTQMHYFEISDKKLLIRNHYFPWKRKEYSLNEIEEVTRESHYHQSDALRIITYDFQSKLYTAGSLRNKHWDGLFHDLASIGIKTNMYNY